MPRFNLDPIAEGNGDAGSWHEIFSAERHGSREAAFDAMMDYLQNLREHTGDPWQSGAAHHADYAWNEEEELWDAEIFYDEYSS